jgi:archaellum component FlaC
MITALAQARCILSRVCLQIISYNQFGLVDPSLRPSLKQLQEIKVELLELRREKKKLKENSRRVAKRLCELREMLRELERESVCQLCNT